MPVIRTLNLGSILEEEKNIYVHNFVSKFDLTSRLDNNMMMFHVPHPRWTLADKYQLVLNSLFYDRTSLSYSVSEQHCGLTLWKWLQSGEQMLVRSVLHPGNVCAFTQVCDPFPILRVCLYGSNRQRVCIHVYLCQLLCMRAHVSPCVWVQYG